MKASELKKQAALLNLERARRQPDHVPIYRAAWLLGRTEKRVYKMVKEGKLIRLLPAVGSMRITRDSIIAVLEREAGQ